MSNCHSVTQLLRALLAFTSSRMTPETRDLWNILSEWKGNMSNILTTLKNYDIFFTFLFTPPTPNPNPVNHFFCVFFEIIFPSKMLVRSMESGFGLQTLRLPFNLFIFPPFIALYLCRRISFNVAKHFRVSDEHIFLFIKCISSIFQIWALKIISVFYH